ncbi:hypothetical protein BBJ28_00011752 [Nothophytophthora sp. Chile5]|nr:hypothetical protein BBJ28_00011752 [Nothophytophthora sp. Chile5]
MAEPTRRATAPEQCQASTKEATRMPLPVEAPSKTTPPMQLPDGEAGAFRHLAHSIVSRTLARESEFRRMRRPELDVKDWKLLKQQEGLRVYKHRSVSKRAKQTEQTPVAKPSKRPMVLCVGSMEGELEDVLYGSHAKTRDEMQATLAFLCKGHVDCAILAKLESGSARDPYRQLSLKWLLSEILGDARLVNHRDLCFLESMGCGTDTQGERYGYQLLQSVDFAGCPPLPESSDIVRASVMMCCIYRQTPGSRVVDVYAKGMFDLGGDLPAFLVYSTSCAMMLSILGAMESAEAKRLTLSALQTADATASSPSYVEPSVQDLELGAEMLTGGSLPSGYSLSASNLSTDVSSTTSKLPKLVRGLSKGRRKTRQQRQKAEPCCVCGRKPAMAALVGATHRACGVCARSVCSKCHVKRRLLAQPQPVAVACCKSCLLDVKQLSVDPRDPCPVLPPARD